MADQQGMSPHQHASPGSTSLPSGEQYLRQLEVLEAITQLISLDRKSETVLAQALYHLRYTLAYPAAQIYRLSPHGLDLWLFLEEGSGDIPRQARRDIFSIEEKNIISDAVRENKLIHIPDTNIGPYANIDPTRPKSAIRSEICFPLPYSQNQASQLQPLGALRIQSEPEQAFSKADIRFLATLANLLAATIQNNQAIEALENDLQEIKILYNLRRQADLGEPASPLFRPNKSDGYQYDRTQLSKTDTLSPTAKLAIAKGRLETGFEPAESGQELVTPIKLYGETIGVIGIESDQGSEPWSADDISLLEEVSDQVALAIENARLIQQTQAQTKELSLLFSASQQLSETIDLIHIYEILTDQFLNYLQADRCTVILLDESGQELTGGIERFRREVHQLVTQSQPWRVRLGQDEAIKRCLAKPEPFIEHLDPDRDQPLPRHDRALSQHIRTLATFPLIIRNRFTSLIEVGHKQAHRLYNQNELQLAQAIISQVAVAVENALQFQRTEEALAETQKLYQISRALVETNNLDEIFEVVLNNVKEFDIDRVSISLLDPLEAGQPEPVNSEMVTIVASWDRESNQILPVGAQITATMFPLVKTFAHPPFNPLISEDLSQPDRQDPRMDEAFRRFMYEGLGAVTMFSTPMFLGTDYKGVLSISTRRPHHYQEQEQRVYQTLADQAIIAIENRRLFETVQRERDQAELLYRIDQKLTQANTLGTAIEIILSFIDLLGATAGEIYISKGQEPASVASTIPERQLLRIGDRADLSTLGLTPELEWEAFRQQKMTILQREKLVFPETYPSLQDIQVAAACPFAARHSDLRGVLTILRRDSDTFSPAHLTRLEAIADQAATVLENLWLLERTGAALRETELLYNASRDFNKAQHPEELLTIMAESLTTYTAQLGMAIDRMLIAMLSRPGHFSAAPNLSVVAHWHRGNLAQPIIETKLSAQQYRFISELTPQQVQTFLYEQLDQASQKNIEEKLGQARTIMAVPLRVGHNWLGTLFLISQDNNFTANRSLINQINTLAQQAAVVIQNLQLVEETQQTLFNSEILSQLGQDLLAADTTTAIYNLSLRAMAATEPERGAFIFMVGPDDNLAVDLVASWDNPSQPWPTFAVGQRFPNGDFELAALLQSEQTIICSEIGTDQRFSEDFQQRLSRVQIESFVAVPIKFSRKTGGLLLISHPEPRSFAVEILRLYEDIARQMSGALEKRYLFEEAQHRASLLQTAAEVSQAATGYLDLDKLMNQSVNLIQERFGFYHVSIFLTDEYKKYAVIKASTGPIGEKMLAMNHKLAIGGRSIVGTATATRKARIALDVGQDGVHFNNPLLPDTRSEMALPLVARGEVIGALDVQSTKSGAFSDNEITILQTMADQLANAIAAALAAQETQQTLEHIQKLNEYYLREQWGEFIRSRQNTVEYRMTDEGINAIKNRFWQPEILTAVENKQPLIVSKSEDAANGRHRKILAVTDETNPNIPDFYISAPDQIETGQEKTLIAPLSLRNGVVIGAIDFELTQADLNWEDDNLRIIEAVTNEAAQAIEAARLFEQTQAAREEAESLYKVGRALVTAESEQSMFYTVLQEMLATLGLKQGGILFFDNSKEFGELLALFENGQASQAGQIIPIKGNASYDRLIETKQPLVIEDVITDPLVETVREINRARNVVSLLLVPIITNDEVVGAIGADSVGEKHQFTQREINLVIAMADQLAIMLQNRRLLEETTSLATQLQASADVGRVASSILDQDLMLDQAVALIKDRFGFYHVQIFLIDDKEQYAVLDKSTGEVGQQLLATNYKVAIGSQGVIGQATALQEAIVIRGANPVDFDTPYQAAYLPESAAELAIPLKVGNSLIGILDIHSSLPNAFSKDEISVLETLAAQLAVATQNARAFREQQETAERLQEIDKLKTQFLANMSHELRTPLNSIIGFSKVILKGIDGPLTELQKTDLTSINNSGQHLLGLINNILDLSKIEAGKMELNFEEVQIEPIIRSVMSTALALVKDKAVSLHQEINEGLPAVWADETRIRQVILNLISNACKFTDEGSVTLRAASNNQRIIISVADTGVGIPADQLETIFEEFTQVDASTTRKVGGTGLGLPISRHFVEMHHGKIWVESTPGQGSTFYFTIPISQREAVEAVGKSIAPAKAQPQEKVIVAIDDDPNVIKLYERFLEMQGYRVVGIVNSTNIIKQVKNHRPSAILLDVLMPDKDGWSIIRELKDDPETEHIPVIICSIVSDKKRGFSLGAADYITKPITESDLLKVLSHLKNQDKSQIKVLVIDDHADDVLLIRRMFEAQPNYSIIEAHNGEEGLFLVTREHPDLIILDLTMPKMDGFGVVEALKNNDQTRSIPIVIVSAKELTSQEDQFLTGQVESLLRKGLFTEKELLEDVRRALSQIHQKDVIKI